MESKTIGEIVEWVGAIGVCLIGSAFVYYMFKLDDPSWDGPFWESKDRQSEKAKSEDPKST